MNSYDALILACAQDESICLVYSEDGSYDHNTCGTSRVRAKELDDLGFLKRYCFQSNEVWCVEYTISQYGDQHLKAYVRDNCQKLSSMHVYALKKIKRQTSMAGTAYVEHRPGGVSACLRPDVLSWATIHTMSKCNLLYLHKKSNTAKCREWYETTPLAKLLLSSRRNSDKGEKIDFLKIYCKEPKSAPEDKPSRTTPQRIIAGGEVYNTEVLTPEQLNDVEALWLRLNKIQINIDCHNHNSLNAIKMADQAQLQDIRAKRERDEYAYMSMCAEMAALLDSFTK